jgi:hypothetical protein
MPVFVSYSTDDASDYDNLIEYLQHRGLVVWSDRLGVVAGAGLREQVRRGVDECDVSVFIATPASVRSPWCLTEVGAFWGQGKPVIVYRVRIDHDSLPDYFRTDRTTDRLKEVAEAAQLILAKATQRLSAPRPATVDDVERLVNAAVAPVMDSLRSGDARPAAPSPVLPLERMIARETNSIALASLAAIDRASRAVGRLAILGEGQSVRTMCTAFLVGPGLLLCPFFVLEDLSPHGMELRVGYQQDADGLVHEGRRVQIPQQQPMWTDKDVDFALIGLDDETIGGHLADIASAKLGSPLVAISHARGEPKSITFGIEITEVSAQRVRYTWASSPGSSGAPLLTASGRVVAMHRSFDLVRDPTGQPIAVDGKAWTESSFSEPRRIGEGVSMDAIHASLERDRGWSLTSLASRIQSWIAERTVPFSGPLSLE